MASDTSNGVPPAGRVGEQTGRILDFATGLIGRGEEGGNNRGPFIEELNRGRRRAGNWCAVFVAYCLEEVHVVPWIPDRNRRGAKALAKYLATAVTSSEWVVEPRWGRSPAHHDTPRPGDVIAWHRGPGTTWRDLFRDWRGHVELVTSYDAGSDTVETIAGNVGRYPAVVRHRIHANGSWRRKLYGVARLGALHSV